jgi:hypothetical protein
MANQSEGGYIEISEGHPLLLKDTDLVQEFRVDSGVEANVRGISWSPDR